MTVTSARNVASEVLLKFEENQKDLVQQLLENAANGETGVPVSTEEPDGTLVFGVAMSVPENATDTQSRYCLVYERVSTGQGEI